MAKFQPLSDEKIEQIRQLRQQGVSRDKIAKQLGVSLSSVRKYAGGIPKGASGDPSNSATGASESSTTGSQANDSLAQTVQKHESELSEIKGILQDLVQKLPASSGASSPPSNDPESKLGYWGSMLVDWAQRLGINVGGNNQNDPVSTLKTFADFYSTLAKNVYDVENRMLDVTRKRAENAGIGYIPLPSGNSKKKGRSQRGISQEQLDSLIDQKAEQKAEEKVQERLGEGTQGGSRGAKHLVEEEAEGEE